MLGSTCFPTEMSPRQKFSRNLFIPLGVVFPRTGVPYVRLSLVGGLSPVSRVGLNHSLHNLDRSGLLIVNSKFSFRGVGRFFVSRARSSGLVGRTFRS